MASSTVETNDGVAPIFCLPNELLERISSYITKISNKMKLEQVCKRLYFVTTGVVVQEDGTKLWPAQSPSWKGIHKLELMMKCFNNNHMVLDGNCNDESYLLNDCLIPFAKWPDAIQSLIQRTQINQLIIHCGAHDQSLFDENPTVLAQLVEIFKENTNRMKIDDFEFHCSSIWNRSGSGIDKIRSFLLNSLQMFTPYLDYLVLNISSGSIGNAPIWPLIKECHHLKYINYSNNNNAIDVDSLIGKSLTKVTFVELIDEDSIDDIVQVINGVSGDGIHWLTLKDTDYDEDDFEPRRVDLKEFCDSLSENSRMKLKFITELNVFNDIFKHFHMIPSMFPNLTRFDVLNLEFQTDRDIYEFFTNIAVFLNNSYDEERMLLIKRLRLYYYDELDDLYDAFWNGCRLANIKPDFLYYMNEDHEISEMIYLSKGNGSVRIVEIFDQRAYRNIYFNGIDFDHEYRERIIDDTDDESD